MSQAQRKQEDRVRTVPPPLPSRRAAVPAPAAVRASVKRRRSLPPPPPLAALRSSRPAAVRPTSASRPASPPPPLGTQRLSQVELPVRDQKPMSADASAAVPRRLNAQPAANTQRSTVMARHASPPASLMRDPSADRPVSAEHAALQLALVPQWEDASAPLHPAPKKRHLAALLFAGAAGSLAIGALVATGAFGARVSDYTDFSAITFGSTPKVQELPVQYIEGDPSELAEPEFSVDEPRAELPETTIVAEPIKAAVSVRAKRRVRRTRATRSVVDTQPDPRVEAAARQLTELDEQDATDDAVEAAATASADSPIAQDSETAVSGVEAPATDPMLPERPTRSDVRVGLEMLRPMLQACAATTHGTAIADIKIAGSGRVSYGRIDGDFAGTAAGSCMASALRGAEFPMFSGPAFTVRYPFAL